MVGNARSRRIARRRKRAIWAAALCSASFITGHVLFGEEPPANKPSLIKQYLEAKYDLVSAPADDESASSSKSKPIIVVAEPVTNDPAPAEAPPAGSLRPAGVSTDTTMPFIPAQPLPTASDLRPAVASAGRSGQPVVVQANVATPSARQSQATDDENLPPIVPAWAVPRPGSKKKPPVVPAKAPEPIKTVQPTAANLPIIQNAPPPMRIELGGNTTPSPATLPQPTPPPSAANKRAEASPLQRLPQVIEMTPRISGFQPATTTKATASKEPLLLPPPPTAQPLPLEIRNPHVSQASPASFEAPLYWPSTAPQHVDDTNPLR